MTLLRDDGLGEQSSRPRCRSWASCTIIVTAAAPHLTSIHGRSPCIVRPTDYDAWLDSGFESRTELEAMLLPADENVTEYPVSPAVGNVKNQGWELIEPVGPS